MIYGVVSMNNKASLTSIFFVIIILIVLAFGLLFTGVITNNLFNQINGDILETPRINETVTDYQTASIPIADTLFIIIFFGIFISLIVTAVYTDAHPVVLGIFMIIFLLFGVTLAMFGSNMFDDMKGGISGNIEGSADTSFMDLLLGDAFPIMMIALFLVFIIIFYSKRSG